MDLLVVGLSHRTAPLEVRERLAFDPGTLEQDLRDFRDLPGVAEAVIVSTCNRVEIYAGVTDAAVAAPELRRRLSERHGVDADRLAPHLYERAGEDGVRHLFRVAASLDSMVVGEPQILGQVKEAYARAMDARTVGPLIQRCVHRALKVARKVRSATGIGRDMVSVSSVAVDLARKIFGSLSDRPVLLLGAGKVSELSLRKLRADGVPRIVVANRSPERAAALAAEFGGEARRLDPDDPAGPDGVAALIAAADIVFVSTGARTYLVTPEVVTAAMGRRRHRPLFIIDVSVPRNVDPRVNDVGNTYLYDVDDLQRVVASNQVERQREAGEAERLVEAEVAAFRGWRDTLSVVPTIVALRRHLTAIQDEETAKVLRRLEAARPPGAPPLSAAERTLVENLGRAIVNRMLHAPSTALKRDGAADASEPVDLATAAQTLFGLGADADRDAGAPDGGL